MTGTSPDIDSVTSVIAETAAVEILPRFQRLKSGDIQEKSGPTDLVTAADLAAEGELTRRLTGLLPGSTVVGEEGTSVEDFTIAMKADFFDNCFLQQDAFDEVDAATPAERQKFIFDKVLEVVVMKFDFDDKNEARKTLVEVSDMFRNLNYAATDSDDYKQILGRIDDFIARKGQKVCESTTTK